MNGFVITHLGKRCKIGSDDSFATIICSLVIQRNEFILEGGNMSGSRIGSWQRIQEGLEVEIEVAEFDDPSDPISEKNQIIEIDPEYRQMASDPDFGLDYKLEMFRRLEYILKKDH